MANQYSNPYIESSCFIAWIKGEVEPKRGIKWKDIMNHVLKLAEEGHYSIVTSSWTLAEVHKRKSGPVLDDSQDRKILKYFEHSWIQIIEVTRELGEQAHFLARKHSIKPTDSVHLACALRMKCDVLLSTDPELLNVKENNILIKEPEIRPLKPLPLFDKDHKTSA